MIHVILQEAVNPVMVPFAKKLARRCLRDGIRYKVYRAMSTTILVETWGNDIAKVTLVGVGVHGYQFIYTGATVNRAAIPGLSYYQQTQGSAVFMLLPKLSANGGVPDFTNVKVYASGSTIEALPTVPPTPPTSDIQLIEKVDNLIQIQLVPEPIWYGYKDFSKPPESAVAYSWSGTQGELYGSGYRMLVAPDMLTDIGYDLPPTVLGGTRPRSRIPDTDWPNEGCRVTVNSAEFGTRHFLIMSAANSRIWCWPDQYDSKEYLDPPSSPYLQQAIKTNVPSSQAKFVDPPFPEWVHTHPEGFTRRDTSFSQYSLEPRYVWRFHPKELKVVGHVLQREQFAASVWARKVAESYTPLIPLEEEIIDDLKIYTGWVGDGSMEWDDLHIDQPGWVEFELKIQLTGPNKEDFNFSMELTRQQQTDETFYPIAVGYLNPVEGGWANRGYEANAGDLLMLSLECYMDTAAQELLVKDTGFTDASVNYLRQAFAKVVNVETGQVIKTFKLYELPQNYGRIRSNPAMYPYFYYRSEFQQIQLETLSFVISTRRIQYTVDEAPYFSFYADTGVPAGIHQVWSTNEGSNRYIVFGQVIKTQIGETDWGGQTVLDETELVDTAVKVSPAMTETRWLYSGATEWEHSDLLSEVVYRMAPNLTENNPHNTFDLFKANVLNAKVLNGEGGLGGFAGLAASNRAYTADYWNSFIAPTAWEIYTTTNAMRAAGDPLPPKADSHIYSHADATYRNAFIDNSDPRLRTVTNPQINQHVYDFPMGAHIYREMWGLVYNNNANFPLTTSHDGFYAGYYRQHYVDGAIADLGIYLSSGSGSRVTRTASTAEKNLTIWNARDTLVNKPDESQFKFLEVDVIGHIRGGETTHAKAYSDAYDVDSPEIPLPTITVYTVNQYSITKKVDYQYLGETLQMETEFYTDPYCPEQPVLNGSAYFL